MPLYEYECTSCDRRTEVIQRFSDEPLTKCSECGGEVKKLLSAPAVQFKGTGWYVTDYGGRKSSEPSSAAQESQESKDSKGSKDSKSEAKSESKDSSKSSSKKAETASSGSGD